MSTPPPSVPESPRDVEPLPPLIPRSSQEPSAGPRGPSVGKWVLGALQITGVVVTLALSWWS